MQQYLEDSDRDLIFQNLKANPDNKKCMDCSKKNPSWASVHLGLFLCYDCAGIHRQYGVHFTFVRSLDLDKWNKRQITFMEIGGNTKALEFFKKHGLVAPFDYKSPIVAKYKEQQTKKVDSMLASNTESNGRIEQPVFVNQKVEEKSQNPVEPTISHSKSLESATEQPTDVNSSPFNNVKIDKAQTKTKGFTVEFSKSKSNSGNGKGRISAKKIDNIDLDSLSLQEDSTTVSCFTASSSMDTVESAFGTGSQEPEVKKVETVTTTSAPFNNVSDEERFQKFKNAKSISSSAFRGEDENRDPNLDVKKFSNANAISSSQFFGNQKESKIDQTMENAKDFLSNVGGKMGTMGSAVGDKMSAVGSVVGEKLKEKAGSLGTMFSNLNTKWQERKAAIAEKK